MAKAWRIVKKSHASSAFDGEGAWRYGGRWNSPGTRVVYCSANLSLAALENLVHLNPPVAFKSVAIELEFDDRLVETIGAKSLPSDWTEEPPACSTMRLGDLWVREGRSAVLELPSANGAANAVDAKRHDGKANYLFVDGHVETLPISSTFDTAKGINLWNPSLAGVK